MRDLAWARMNKKRGRESYCSRSCASRAGNARRVRGKALIRCAHCGEKVFIRAKELNPRRKGGPRRFCSNSCGSKHRMVGQPCRAANGQFASTKEACHAEEAR